MLGGQNGKELKMKKLIPVILALLLMLSLAACNANDPSELPSGTSDAETTAGSDTTAGAETTRKPFVPLEDGMMIGGSEGVYWKLNSGALLVFGDGAAPIPPAGAYPWVEYADAVTEIRIGTGVTSLGEGAFRGFADVTSLWIEDGSVTELGAGSFASCTSLETVTLGDALTEISADCFRGCSALTSVSIPSAVSAIEDGAFAGCTSLRLVYFEGSLEEWAALTIGTGNEALLAAEVYCTAG